MSDKPSNAAALHQATRLAIAITRLRARLRAEAAATPSALSVSQLALLHRVLEVGPTTTAALAAAEHVTPQSISQTLAGLRTAGFVDRTTDPTDGRKVLIQATAAGRQYVDGLLAARVDWLADGLMEVTAAGGGGDITTAIDLIERLAASPAERSK